MKHHKLPAQYLTLQKIELQFGNAESNVGKLAFDKILAHDDASRISQSMQNHLDAMDINEYFVPVALGGKLSGFEELMMIFKLIYRRDPTLGLGYGATTFMASVPVWVSGTDLQKKKLATKILQKQKISVAFHEMEHGNDLLGNQVNAATSAKGYIISGQKKLINNIEICAGMTLFARSNVQGGARGFSLFYVNKDQLKSKSINYAKKIKTHGVKGCKISGIEFADCRIPKDAILGKEGDGLELTLKAFQITRAIIPGMSIGAMDTVLRKSITHYLENANAGSLKHTQYYRNSIIRAAANMFIADCMSIASCRALHVIPQQMSVNSAIVKYYVPTTLLSSLRDLVQKMGIQALLREGDHAIIEKLLRDYPVVSLGHASGIICQSTIIPQLRQLAKNFLANHQNPQNINLEPIFNLGEIIPDFNPAQLQLSNHGKDAIAQSLLALQTKLNQVVMSDKFVNCLMIIRNYVDVIYKSHINLCEHINAAQNNVHEFSKYAYQFTHHYSITHAAIACVSMWLYNRKIMSPMFSRGIWLIVCLGKLIEELNLVSTVNIKKYETMFFRQLLQLHTQRKLFSILPIDLAETTNN